MRPPCSSGRSRAAVATGLAALVLPFLLATDPTSATSPRPARPAPAAPALTATPAHPLQDTRTTLRVRLPTRFARPTVLQRRSEGRWVAVARRQTAVDGRVTYRVRVPRTTTYRVTAKAVTRQGRRLDAISSRPRTVTPTPRTSLVSHRPNGRPADAGAYGSSVSGDGRYVVFTSVATNLHPPLVGQVAGRGQVYLYDRIAGGLTLVSHDDDALDGAGNADSTNATISEDGRYVAFASYASNLTLMDANGKADIFRFDRTTGTIIRISRPLSGPGTNDDAYDPVISADGDEIAYTSRATNVVEDDDNATNDVFVWTADDGERHLVSETLGGDVGNAESNGPEISANGRYVVFMSEASDLVFNDGNLARDVFRYDVENGTTALVSRGFGEDADSVSGPSAVSADGRLVAFSSYADNLVEGGTPDNERTHVFLRDLTAGTTTWVSRSRTGGPINGFTFACSISADGREVAFTSVGDNVVAGDTEPDVADAYLWRRGSTRSRLLIRDRGWGLPDGSVYEPTLSADGRFVAFSSAATDLVAQDSSATPDIYLWRR